MLETPHGRVAQIGKQGKTSGLWVDACRKNVEIIANLDIEAE